MIDHAGVWEAHSAEAGPASLARTGAETGFTLIEVLVVVAIIAILLAVLLPSLANARQQAKIAKCLANLKSLGIASNAYIIDSRDRFCWGSVYPPTRTGDVNIVTWYPGGNRGASSAELGRQSIYDLSGTIYHFDPPQRPLNRYVTSAKLGTNTDLRVFECPSDLGVRLNGDIDAKLAEHVTAYRETGTSYQANNNWVYFSRATEAPSGTPEGIARRKELMDKIVKFMERGGRAQRFLLLYEDPADWGLSTSDDLPDGYKVRSWHGKFDTHSVLFLDGHARHLYIDYRRNRMNSPINGTATWVARYSTGDL